jgi:lysozyme family protein
MAGSSKPWSFPESVLDALRLQKAHDLGTDSLTAELGQYRGFD